MAAARLSPAASLLRNSKLFALPAALTTPPTHPSSEPTPRSDTATTSYPIRAAIETPLQSLNTGDWGLKRPLPLKSTTNTANPTIRIQGGIDTSEHVVDFESAADHVRTMQKWQELNLPMELAGLRSFRSADIKALSVFNPSDDNTSDLPANAAGKKYTQLWPDQSPELAQVQTPRVLRKYQDQAYEKLQAEAAEKDRTFTYSKPTSLETTKQPKRWRYDGPWLAGLTGMQFDAYLKNEVRNCRPEFRDAVKRRMVSERMAAQKREAMEEGESTEHSVPEISAEEVNAYIRKLRSDPKTFGHVIASLLDLPEGPLTPSKASDGPWEYGRDTASARFYVDAGPPKMHPSAGLSYTRTKNYSINDPIYGPQEQRNPVIGRILKTKKRGSFTSVAVGVAGFVVPSPLTQGMLGPKFEEFVAQKGGRKTIVRPEAAMINGHGGLDLQVKMADANHRLEGDRVVRNDEVPKIPDAYRGSAGGRVPELDNNYGRGTVVPKVEIFENRASERRRVENRRIEDPDILAQLGELRNRTQRKNR